MELWIQKVKMWWGLAMCPAGGPAGLCFQAGSSCVLLSLFQAPALLTAPQGLREASSYFRLSLHLFQTVLFPVLLQSFLIWSLLCSLIIRVPCSESFPVHLQPFDTGRITTAHIRRCSHAMDSDIILMVSGLFLFYQLLILESLKLWHFRALSLYFKGINYITFEYCPWVAVISSQSIILYRKLNLVFTLHITSHFFLSNFIAQAQSLLKF